MHHTHDKAYVAGKVPVYYRRAVGYTESWRFWCRFVSTKRANCVFKTPTHSLLSFSPPAPAAFTRGVFTLTKGRVSEAKGM